jgi:phage terminase large subunit
MEIDLKLKKGLFNDAYYPYLFSYKNRYEVYYGGGGSGKSYFITEKLILKALKSKRKILALRKIDRTVENSIYQLFKDELSHFKLIEYCKLNKTTHTIELPNGSIILCAGLSESERIKSITGITDIWMEEATEFTQDDFSQLDLRLRARSKNLQIFLSFNPVSKANWVYKLFFSDEAPQDINQFRKKVQVVQTTYKDNKFLPQSYIDSIESLIYTNPTYYKVYALGEFASLDKLVFVNWDVEDINEPLTNLKLLCGLDFGYVNDATAFVASYLDEQNKIIYCVDEFYKTGMLNDEIANMIIEKGYGKERIIADSAEQKSIEEIKRKGIPRIKPSIKGKGSILQGIQKLQQYKLIVSPNCSHLITELQNYSWKKDRKTNEYVNEPVDEFNHCIDALRYSLQCAATMQKLKSIDKSVFSL